MSFQHNAGCKNTLLRGTFGKALISLILTQSTIYSRLRGGDLSEDLCTHTHTITEM
ncbi:hypothetical protein SAMN02745866_04197 [Alteromonadaceae bacterium Bs31]|nr:hypothetical protein SAMN02745866_04197 [Alteromonadaceae bacterium Bs31]